MKGSLFILGRYLACEIWYFIQIDDINRLAPFIGEGEIEQCQAVGCLIEFFVGDRCFARKHEHETRKGAFEKGESVSSKAAFCLGCPPSKANNIPSKRMLIWQNDSPFWKKTSLFSSDVRSAFLWWPTFDRHQQELTGLMYRQMSGRAGRRWGWCHVSPVTSWQPSRIGCSYRELWFYATKISSYVKMYIVEMVSVLDLFIVFSNLGP